MNKKVLRLVVCGVLFVALTAAGVLVHGKFREKDAYYSQLLEAGEVELAEELAVQAELANPPEETAEERAARLARQKEEIQQELEQAREENSQLGSDVTEKQAEYDQKAEDNAYYQAIYDSLSEGMAKVEGYIDGN